MILENDMRAAARAAGIAIFEDRLILEAQPPIDDATLAKIEQHCAGPVPEGLKALWAVSFGGRLDYNLRFEFEGEIAGFSFSEIFYPDSGATCDLWGWIAHEEEGASANEDGPLDRRLHLLPFGGLEHFERLYVCVAPGREYGKVFAWMQGMPESWPLGLHSDSIAMVADDVPSLFRQLVLAADPFAPGIEPYRTCVRMTEAIGAVAETDPQTAEALTALVKATVQDWRAAVESGEISTSRDLQVLALENATAEGDLALIIQLAGQGCDLKQPLGGGGNLLDHAMAHGNLAIAQWLIGRGLDVRSALVNGAGHASPEITRVLLARGADVSAAVVANAAAAGLKDTARLIADSVAAHGMGALKETIDTLDRRAESAETIADRIESGETYSDLTFEQYREKAANLRTIQAYCVRLTAPRKSR
jgi:hypothetical protein